MNPIAVLQIIRASLGVISLLSSLGVDISKLVALQNKAAAEGREISAAELADLAANAQAAINKLENIG